MITSSSARARLPPSARGVRVLGSGADSATVETSFTVVLLITPIPSLEGRSCFWQGPLCRTDLYDHRSMNL
ncbi:hypothetical protein GCM10010385_53820 [Streptomyces geysiriensis]|nr:hypothetical protein GCM10010385_53820 [Streptomyces geysiriensis]